MSQASFTLFVTGNAPRSQRARANLAEALAHVGLSIEIQEIDLVADPEKTLAYGIFATPALMRTSAGSEPEVVYGDLSERKTLERFLVLH